MDVTSIARMASSIAETGTSEDVALAVLKRSQDIASSTASQLIEAVNDAPTVQNLPPHLGNHINTTA